MSNYYRSIHEEVLFLRHHNAQMYHDHQIKLKELESKISRLEEENADLRQRLKSSSENFQILQEKLSSKISRLEEELRYKQVTIDALIAYRDC